ncbi:HAD family hydrolase [Pseudaeromonas sharmana]|uniref:HAD family hydrolase n=1 Tax=Pseudaeromonas sharmana TaxID=328412 RepID=A0ABV8CLM5_9GAMM
MILERFKALIFDMDGTLVDSMPLHLAAWMATAQEYGFQCDAQWLYAHGGVPSRKIAAKLASQQNLTLDPQQVAATKTAHYVARIASATPFPEMMSLVERAHGHWPMAIGTGSLHANAERILEQSGLGRFIHTVVAADDVLEHKPAPDTFLQAARLLQVKAEDCLVFEDTEIGCQAALAAGMACVMVVDGVPDWSGVRYP